MVDDCDSIDRLWIHAASKDPDPVDIEGLEGYYRDLYETGTSLVEQKSENAKLKKSTTICLPFPSEYPTSCLLGCVDLVDCMTQVNTPMQENNMIRIGELPNKTFC